MAEIPKLWRIATAITVCLALVPWMLLQNLLRRTSAWSLGCSVRARILVLHSIYFLKSIYHIKFLFHFNMHRPVCIAFLLLQIREEGSFIIVSKYRKCSRMHKIKRLMLFKSYNICTQYEAATRWRTKQTFAYTKNNVIRIHIIAHTTTSYTQQQNKTKKHLYSLLTNLK